MDNKDLNNTRPLVPRLLLQNESSCEETLEEVRNRFDLPAAKLSNLPDNFLESICSQVLNNPDDKISDYIEEDRISYTAISSIKYLTLEKHTIYITTLLLSRRAADLNTRIFDNMVSSDGSKFVKKVPLTDGSEAALFSNPSVSDSQNQITFLSRHKNYTCQITVGSNIPMEKFIKIVSEHLVVE